MFLTWILGTAGENMLKNYKLLILSLVFIIQCTVSVFAQEAALNNQELSTENHSQKQNILENTLAAKDLKSKDASYADEQNVNIQSVSENIDIAKHTYHFP